MGSIHYNEFSCIKEISQKLEVRKTEYNDKIESEKSRFKQFLYLIGASSEQKEVRRLTNLIDKFHNVGQDNETVRNDYYQETFIQDVKANTETSTKAKVMLKQLQQKIKDEKDPQKNEPYVRRLPIFELLYKKRLPNVEKH